jgi:hypothetical protein
MNSSLKCTAVSRSSLRDLAGARVVPLCRRAGQHPAGGQGAHGHELEAGRQRVRQLLGEIGLAQAGLAEQQHRRELHGFVAGDRERQELAQVVDHGPEVRRGVVELVDGGGRGRLDDVARAAQLAHAVVPALEALVALSGAVSQRAIDLGHRIDGLQIGQRNHRFHGASVRLRLAMH